MPFKHWLILPPSRPPLWKIPLICFKPSLIMFLRLITSKFQVSFDPIKRPFLCFTMVSLSPLRCRRLLSVSIIVSNTIVILTITTITKDSVMTDDAYNMSNEWLLPLSSGAQVPILIWFSYWNLGQLFGRISFVTYAFLCVLPSQPKPQP